jgi:cytochrome c oxidase subunit 2
MKRAYSKILAAALMAGAGLAAGTAHAQAPRPWEIGMQPGFSPVKQDIIALHNLVLTIITLITILVGALLVWVMVRYNAKRNPVPSRTSHNTVLEIAWTVLPILILVIIAIPSFRLVYYEDRTVDPDLTIKVTGHQWYWEYTFPDKGPIDYTSMIIAEEDLKPGQLRLLDVNNPLELPVGKKVRILITSGDVIHSFFIPSLGVQRYAIPGRTIETWVEITQPGDYYGECNQICGANHSQMPISIHAVPPAEFDAWLVTAKAKFAQNETPAEPGAITVAEVRH